MYERRIEPFVQLEHGVAEFREDVAGKLDGRVAAVHDVGQRLAPHVFHDHDAPLAHRVAVGHEGQMKEPPSRALRAPDALVGGAQPRLAVQVLAHVRPLLGSVRPYEEHALRRLEGPFLHDGIDAVAVVARERIEMFGEFVHDGYMVAERRAPAPVERHVRALRPQPQQIVSSPKR